jgi:phospholipase C
VKQRALESAVSPNRSYEEEANVAGLESIEHVVFVMLENRSFDHLVQCSGSSLLL